MSWRLKTIVSRLAFAKLQQSKARDGDERATGCKIPKQIADKILLGINDFPDSGKK